MSWKSKTGFCLFILWLHTPTALSSSRFFKFSIWLTASVSHREACIALLFPSNIPTGDATEPESTDLGHRSNLGHQLCYKWSFTEAQPRPFICTLSMAASTLQWQLSSCDRDICGFPGGASGKEPACQCRRLKRQRFSPWGGKVPWRRAQQPTPVFLPGESHGQSLVGYSPWGHKESNKTEAA